jgi:hypothetical protein
MSESAIAAADLEDPRARRRDASGKFLKGYANPGAARRAALAGNLNRAGARPWSVFFRRRALRPEHRWALAIYREYLDGVASDMPDTSEMETRAAELAAVARTCSALLLTRMAEDTCGPEERLDLFRELRGFGSLELKALGLLGLKRRPRELPSLSAYVQTRTVDLQSSAQPSQP